MNLLVRTTLLVACLALVTLPRPGSFPDCGEFRRGDADGDGILNVTDAIHNLLHLFAGGDPPPCRDAADSNDDGVINLSDATHLLQFLFMGSSGLPAPGLTCGRDATADDLDCLEYAPCVTEQTENAANCGPRCFNCEDKNWDRVVLYDCVEGECRIAGCEDGFYDFDGIAENGCESLSPPNGTPCDDGNPCTENDMYLGGLCGGTPRNCFELSDDCNEGACDRATGECIRVPRRQGSPCDDGDPRTINDRCDGSGHCVGTHFP